MEEALWVFAFNWYSDQWWQYVAKFLKENWLRLDSDERLCVAFKITLQYVLYKYANERLISQNPLTKQD